MTTQDDWEQGWAVANQAMDWLYWDRMTTSRLGCVIIMHRDLSYEFVVH